MSRFINRVALWLPTTWGGISWPQLLFLPITLFFYLVVQIRRLLYAWQLLPSSSLPVPVVIIGNLTVGGAGKTPLTIALANHLKKNGFKPGVISRGYGRKNSQILSVDKKSDYASVGDEPMLIAASTEVPVFVGSNRLQVAKALLLKHSDCDVIISDDGLQHYCLNRDYEVVVVDGNKGFGNGLLLPAGPLREPLSRALKTDAIVVNGGAGVNGLPYELRPKACVMQLKASSIYQLNNSSIKFNNDSLRARTVLAVAGIGNPERFFNTLDELGLSYVKMAYPDHYDFGPEDFSAVSEEVILMTEKDAVKCRDFADSRFWVLPVTAELDAEFLVNLKSALKKEGKLNGF